MYEELKELLRNEGPFDVVLSDFITWPGIRAANDLNIPCILNMPGPVAPVQKLSMWLALPRCRDVFLATRSLRETIRIFEMYCELIPVIESHVCLVNSFYGLDIPA